MVKYLNNIEGAAESVWPCWVIKDQQEVTLRSRTFIRSKKYKFVPDCSRQGHPHALQIKKFQNNISFSIIQIDTIAAGIPRWQHQYLYNRSHFSLLQMPRVNSQHSQICRESPARIYISIKIKLTVKPSAISNQSSEVVNKMHIEMEHIRRLIKEK